MRLSGVPAVASKKNRREWIVRGGRRLLVPSAAAASDEMGLRLLAARAGSLIVDDDVELRIVYHARSGTIDLECESIGPRPKGFTGRKRDAHGMIETIADALQGSWFTNDSQIARLFLERLLD